MVERTIRPRYASGFLDFLHDAGNREDTFILIPEDLVKVVLGSTPIPTS
jgi:hypothetical protein